MTFLKRLAIVHTFVLMPALADGPVINAIVNAASYSNQCVGMPSSCILSPGEIVTIFGTSLGPVSPQGLQYDPTTGAVLTLLGSTETGDPCNRETCSSWVQVVFNTPTGGYAAPLLYVSATQINCIVPYEIAAVSLFDQSNGPHPLSILLNSSNGSYEINDGPWIAMVENSIPSAAPAIFTDNGSGTGQGAVLNQDESLNGPMQPERAGNIVSVYMTGAGWLCTNPDCVIEFGVPGNDYGNSVPAAMIDGMITCILGCPDWFADIPNPVLPLTVLVNGNPAKVVWAGSAPGLVSGALQVNLEIPSNTPSGTMPLKIVVGGNQSQPGVTLSVK